MDGRFENAPERTMEFHNDDVDHQASSSLANQHLPQHIPVETGNTRRRRDSSLSNWTRKRHRANLQTHLHIEKLAYSLRRQTLETKSSGPPVQSLVPLSTLILQDGDLSGVPSRSTPIIDSRQGTLTQPSVATDWACHPNTHLGIVSDHVVPSLGQTPSCQPGSHNKSVSQPSSAQILNPVMEVDDSPIEVDDNLVDPDEGYFDKAQKEVDEALSVLSSHRKSGRLPYRSSQEAALNCPHAIRNIPRMRRRKHKVDKRQHRALSESSQTARQARTSDAARPSTVPMSSDTRDILMRIGRDHHASRLSAGEERPGV
ncbi:unnamed protein product [Clonostachys chloroleuca]|uniref:Uncharacterized protein n=1 Tax=Clonostachys chloroleuca TaxID=1926264 RepID=A0AA35QDR5_9HYPO|nr:unnamed protein product [Clonostachys chloroleuca]